jgi:hypothetical protein
MADDNSHRAESSAKDDVDEAATVVKVRAIRHKPPHETTEEIL